MVWTFSPSGRMATPINQPHAYSSSNSMPLQARNFVKTNPVRQLLDGTVGAANTGGSGDSERLWHGADLTADIVVLGWPNDLLANALPVCDRESLTWSLQRFI